MTSLTRTARLTGAFYLGLGITGMLGFLLIRPQVFIAGDAAAALEALAGNLPLARVGVVLELGIVITQVLTALWFSKLFRPVSAFAAASLATLGVMNAVAILGSAASLATAVRVDLSADAAATQVGTLIDLSVGFWTAGNLFFGAWLIPMGYLVVRSAWVWRPIGWVLIVGGVGYIASLVVTTLAPEAALVVGLLAIPATIGEFAMIGYLLIRGVSARARAATEA